MSTTPAMDPTQQQPPPFPPVIQEQAYKPHSGHGSVGPVIGVLAVIMVLGVVAIMIGRLCSGRRIMGHMQYDFEGWVETKCSTCIDGRLGPPAPREAVPVVVVVERSGSNVSEAGVAVDPPDTLADDPPHAEEVLHEQQAREPHEQQQRQPQRQPHEQEQQNLH